MFEINEICGWLISGDHGKTKGHKMGKGSWARHWTDVKYSIVKT